MVNLQSVVLANTGGYITNTILTNLIDFLAPLVALAMVVYAVVQGWKVLKGSEGASMKKLLTGIGVIVFMLGLMYAAGSFQAYAGGFKSVVESLLGSTSDNAGQIVGGASK
jgi:hypothetical protein